MITENQEVLSVLIACEESQAECGEFRRLGHLAFSCDIQPCKPSGHPDWHIQQDVTPLLAGEQIIFTTQDGEEHCVPQWDLIIAHPPCTYLCKVGSPWLYKDPDSFQYTNKGWIHVNRERFNNMLLARHFFFNCLNANAPYVAVENPLPMSIADLPTSTTYCCPSWYGDKYTKKTLYWLKNLPPLFAEMDNPDAKSLSYSSRGKYRSRTRSSLAKALAKQWSEFILSEHKDCETIINNV